MKNLIFLVLALLLLSCTNNDKKNIPILKATIKSDYKDASNLIRFRYNDSISRSFLITHNQTKFLNNEELLLSLSTDYKNLYIINLTTDSLYKIKNPLDNKLPISHIHMHSYDSIFLFVDRDFKLRFKQNRHEIPDFVLINLMGEVINLYNLDGVPYLYNGIKNPSVYNSSYKNNIKSYGNSLYIPLAVYLPELGDSAFSKYSFKLVCKYDLKSEKVEMLNINIPNKYHGYKFNESVVGKVISISDIDKFGFYYSLSFSPNIYRYSFKTKSASLIKEFPNFPFQNIDSVKYSVFFNEPYYVSAENKYLRQFYVKNLDNYENFYASQLLDDEMNLIAYSFGDSNFTSLQTNKDGIYIIRDKNNSYIGHAVDIEDEIITQDIDFVKENYLIKKKGENILKNKKINAKNTIFETRIKKYLKELDLLQYNKVVLITTEVICYDCLKFIIDYYKKNEEKLIENKVVYLFIGKNIKFINEIVKNYELEVSTNIFIDSDILFVNYFKQDESFNNYFIEKKDNLIQLKAFNYSNVSRDIEEFIESK